MTETTRLPNHVSCVPGVRRGYTDCGHGQLHYRTAGPENSPHPVLVMLHQNPASSFEYEPLIAAMGGDRRVIAFDTPGYGMSDAPPAPPGMAGYAAAFAEGLDSLGITGPVDLYGFHTGTLLAIELAILRAQQVRRLVLSGIPMYPENSRAEKLRAAEQQPEPDEAGEVIREHLDKMWTYIVANRDRAVPLAKAVWNYSDKVRVLHRFTWAYRGVWSWDLSRIALVTQPALVLQPAEDLREVSLAAAKVLPDASVVELPELNRDIFDIAPERLAQEIRAFLG